MCWALPACMFIGWSNNQQPLQVHSDIINLIPLSHPNSGSIDTHTLPWGHSLPNGCPWRLEKCYLHSILLPGGGLQVCLPALSLKFIEKLWLRGSCLSEIIPVYSWRSPSFYKIGEEWKENSLKNLGGEKTQSPQYRLFLPTLFCIFVCYTSSLGFLPGLSNTGEWTQHLPNIFAKLSKGLTESD